MAAPVNDLIQDAIALSGYQWIGTNLEATATDNTSYYLSDIWFTWVAPTTATHQVDTIGSAFDTLLAVHTSTTEMPTALSHLTLVAQDDDAGGGSGTSRVAFSATAGTRYWISVSGYGGARGNIVLNYPNPIPPTEFPDPGSATAAVTVDITAGEATYPFSVVPVPATAAVTVTANPGDRTVFYAVRALVTPGTPIIGQYVVGVTAAIAATTDVGAVVVTEPGDHYEQPIEISGATGTQSLGFDATLQAGEPAVAAGGEAATMWLEYTAADLPGELTIPVDADHYVEVFDRADGAPITELTPVDLFTGEREVDTPPLYSVSDGDVTLTTASAGRYLLRAYPKTGVATPWDLAWSFVERVPELIVEVLSDLEQAPGQLLVTVTNVPPQDLVTFSIAEDPDFFTEEADTSGVLFRVSVPIDSALPAGTHALTVTAASGQFGTAEFEVLTDPALPPTPLPEIPDPLPVPATGVPKWQVQDRIGNVTLTTVFPYNPSETSNPYAPRPFSLRTTTSPGGQALTWEGAYRAQEWTLTGYLDTQDFYEYLENLVSSEKRYWLIDHRRQYRLVSFESFEPEYKRAVLDGQLNNWSFTYRLTVLIYRHLLEVR